MTNPPAAGTAPPAQPGEWVADLAACTVSFTVRNFGLRTVTGQIHLNSAALIVGPSGQPVSVRANLDARRIDTGNRRRDSDLRGPRFFATDRWPAISFQASHIQASEAGWTIDGTLTVKDRHCPVRLDVGCLDMPPGQPAAHVTLHATGRLDRRLAGVDAAPAFLVGHTISLSLTVRLCPPAAVSGVSPGRTPDTTTPAKEGRI
jgi:polyisoprenoid-binding protein YceI